MTLVLTEADVENILTMPDAIRVVEDAFREIGNGHAINRSRQRVRVPNGILHVMPAGLPTRGYLGFKYYSAFRPKPRFWFHLIDANTGNLVAVMQADRLGQQRTGAASGVATKYLAREEASSVGIIGTGWQAESQLQAVCAVRKIRVVYCFSRDADKRQAFAQKMSAMLNVEVRAVKSAEEAMHGIDIAITITTTHEPVLYGDWLVPGTHVNAAGANRVEARELDDRVIQKSALICTDSVEQARLEAGDLVSPVQRGLLSWNQVYELGQVVAGKVRGRANRDDITVFKSLGIALEDVAVGAWVYERARERMMGKQIEL